MSLWTNRWLIGFLRLLLRWFYGFRTFNEQVLKARGPVLLVPNHVSWLDFLFVGVCLEGDWRFVTSGATARTTWLHQRIMVNGRTFPIDPASPYAVKRMAEHLASGGRLVLFAEGRISATGSLMKLYEGTGFLLHKTQAQVVTAYQRGANRIRWVRHRGWTRWFPRVQVHFSPLLTPPKLEQASMSHIRTQLSQWLRQQMVNQQFRVEMEQGSKTVLEAVSETARHLPRKVVLEDVSRQPVSYRRLMLGVDLLAGQWRALLKPDQERIGVLLPNVNATPLVLLSLRACGKVPAILNFSQGTATLLNCARLGGLKTVITSRRFIERAKLAVAPLQGAGLELLYLEDVRSAISGWQKTGGVIRRFLRRPLGAGGLVPEQTAVILFTSGSEGLPKGVELTERNLLANIRQMVAMIDFEDSERFFNALPLFHSFGLTVGTLLPLVRGLYVFLYPSPLHYRLVPSAVYDRDCTVMLATNTFLNGYARKAHPYDFRSLSYLFAGAEKIQESTTDLWARRFGVRVLEGYGATECSPCISVNTPLSARFGSAGQLMPSLEYKLEDVEGVSEGGRLLVRGPNVMRGYLNPDANACFQALGGWYDTGDIVRIDTDGFVYILGRLKRFAKISGEMVSLTAVEEALAGAFPRFGLRCEVAILSRPDEEKGEALVAITNERRLQLDEIRAVLRAKGLSNLCAPREVKFVREIPRLGTGKVNHRELAQLMEKEVARIIP